MEYPTYSLNPAGVSRTAYLRAVERLADQVVARGEELHGIVSEFGDFVAYTGQEARRSHDEYLLEALLLGVLWRARGEEAAATAHGCLDVLRILATERRAGFRRRDGSNAVLLALDAPTGPAKLDPSLEDLDNLFEWLLATGEYDDELVRLRAWQAFLADVPSEAPAILRALVAFAAVFEEISCAALGKFTNGVDDFLRHELPKRGAAEDTVQCSRTRVEYHFNMVGAEILNRAWRKDFLACERHVVVLPGCARRRSGTDCLAYRLGSELRCRGCSRDCAVAGASEIAARNQGEALAVLHGSDFGRFLASPTLSGGDVGIVGVACAAGLVGAGWRARAQGLPAQCVLLDSSGCQHWRSQPQPTSLDLGELDRILKRSRKREQPAEQPSQPSPHSC